MPLCYDKDMLNIYYADAQADKEKFIFDHIDSDRQTILIVPDQFSLQAEQDALRYCGRALLNLMVTDFSALGHKVVKQTDGHEPRIIDKYGRHILLSVLIGRMDEELSVLRSRGKRSGVGGLADQMNTMISELKRYEISPEKLSEVIGQLRQEGNPCVAGGSAQQGPARAAGSYLILKLEDMLRIYQAYEQAIDGLYRDAEDYITYYADRIPKAELVQGSDVWIYGFDTFTPKNLEVIRRLLETARSVSVVMTYTEDGTVSDSPARALTRGGGAGLFRLTEQVMQRLDKEAEVAGCETRLQRIDGYSRESLWDAGDSETLKQRIHLVQTSGVLEEAESAAAFIQSLVRDEGYHYGEIAVLCNDMDGRGRMIRRTMERWDIPVFADQKRKVLHQPVISFLLSFLEVLTDGLNGSGIAGMIKSGLPGFDADDEELLENYMKEFRIRGGRWQKEFVLDGGVYSEEELQRLNAMRVFLVELCGQAKDSIGRRNTAREKVRGLIEYLEDGFHIRERIRQTVDRQEELHLQEGAAETAQIWNAICGILDQIVQIIGEEKVSNALLRDMITAGLETLEIGLVPASRDCVLMGTLQRSRPGRIRALVVTGANAGLLPMDVTEEGLLSRHEKERLEAMDLEFAGRKRIAQMEEQLAIYRMFSLPSERLYVSCSQSGEDGSMLRPSELFRVLLQWQPHAEGDPGRTDRMSCIGSGKATVPYLAGALRQAAAEEPDHPAETVLAENVFWTEVLDWYRRNDPVQVDRLLRGARFDNHQEALGEEMADALYRGDRQALEVSASRLEKYSGCPFAHFIQYGLRAREQRIFEVGGREIGDVYHRCLMEFSRELEAGSSARKDWNTITEEECREQIAGILFGSAADYREGLFAADEYNQFRMERINEICGDIAWALVCQVRQGKIRRMLFEEPFGRTSADGGSPSRIHIPAVEVQVGGRPVRIRGVIDRLDMMDAGEGEPDGIRIIDYKTGSNTIQPEYFRAGYKLQLMVYMDAALKAEPGDGTGDGESPREEETGSPVPAGVFYFKIRDFRIDGDTKKGVPDAEDPEDLQMRMKEFYRMEGIAIDDRALMSAQDQRLDGKASAESSVIPIKYDPKKESYVRTRGGTLMQQEEFRQLMEETRRQIERICSGIYRGGIAASPKRETKTDMQGGRITACRYCGFRSICGFDPSIRGCRYDDV